MIKFFKRIYSFFFKRNEKLSVENVEDIPEKPKKNYIYIVDNWAISLKCPCGCSKDIHLNTLSSATPSWNFEIKNGLINISPSVNRLKGCKSHFWVKDGKIHWC